MATGSAGRYTLPTSFTAGRALNIAGTLYAQGATIPNPVVAGIKKVSALLSKGFIVPNVDQAHRRTVLSKPTPRTLDAGERRALLGYTPSQK
jgi:hypothetical protein